MFMQNTSASSLLHASAFAVGCACAALATQSALAGPREQAKRMHDRIAGVPPSESVLDAMEADIIAGRAEDAAYTAMDDPAFYGVTLKNFVTPWTNRERTVFAPLNDYVATVIGMVRDDVPFNTLLSANLVYVGNANGLPAYSMSNNDHYEAIEDRGLDLQQILVARQQTAVMDIPAEATAGVLTTRGAASAFFFAGTNRAMFRFTILNHLCTDLEQIKDTTRPPDRIRQDVTRSPGGDSRIFLNNCIGCHSGMDPMAQAFAYYEFDQALGRMVYSPGEVQAKYHINSDNFKYGYVTPDDHWDNYWRNGQNALLGWDENLPGSGSGAKSMGHELESSEAFAECQVSKVFENVCFRAPVDGNDRAQIASMVASFQANGYRLRQVFAESAAYCMGD
jgi:hypothetical protein